MDLVLTILVIAILDLRVLYILLPRNSILPKNSMLLERSKYLNYEGEPTTQVLNLKVMQSRVFVSTLDHLDRWLKVKKKKFLKI